MKDYTLSLQSDTQAIPPDWVRALLRKLAQANGYQGPSSDIDALKKRSTELKSNPNANKDSITLLDSAVASYVDEIGPAVSTQKLAKVNDIGKDIYPDFIAQKVKFLESEKAKFYDGGPLEIAWRSLLVSSLEAEYFLQQKAANADGAKLRSAIQVLDEILVRRRSSDSKYAYISNKSGPLLNGDRFWRASLLFALGARAEAETELRSLILDNQLFGLEVKSPLGDESSRHVYIYKAFSFPHQILVQADPTSDGLRRTEAKDPDIIDRYYNAAQLALWTCAHLDEAGSQKGISLLAKEIKNLELNDYYVIAGSADTPKAIQDLASSLDLILKSEALSSKRDQLIQQFAIESKNFSETVSHGASKCGIANDVRAKIFAPFDFRVSRASIPGLGTANEYLLLGGRLNAQQADTLVSFLNKAIYQRPEAENSGLKSIDRPYSARMKIAQ